MAALIRTYPNEEAARQAVEALQAAGVQPRHIRVLTAGPARNSAHELRGGFAGPVEPAAPVGTFAGRERGPIGSFATGQVQGKPEQRRGSFGDAERVVVAGHEPRALRFRVTGYRGIRRLLRRAALDDSAVDHAVRLLHKGHSVVLVDGAETASSSARTLLDELSEAA